VRASFWGFLTSALVLLINGLLALGSREAFRAAAKRMLTLTGRAAEVNAARLDELTTANVVMAVLVSAVIAGLLVLFAYKARSGRNWARVVLALAAVGAILQLATAPLSVPAFVGGALAVLAAVPLFLPRADAYFRAARSAR
jgi:heme/copper-type cytochrome/quinol oxidase subunit 2